MTADATPQGPAAAPLPAAHGAQPTRGIGNVPRSSTETGKFGRLFRTLTPLALTDSQIESIVASMVDAGDSDGGGGWGGAPSAGDSTLASGWTYFGQFVDHDITFDPTSMLDQTNDPDALENFRTPRFDLDSLYGFGPAAHPWLFDSTDPDKLLIGQNDAGFTPRDLSRNQQGRALIGDPRNDVHVIVSQMHLAMALFHNRVVDLVRADPSLVTGVPATPAGGWVGTAPTPDRPSFGQIVTLVRWHYQWIVLNEFLPLLVGEDTHGKVLTRDKKGRLQANLELYSVRRKPWMPVEFSAAAYRFGHSLVRDSYILNSGLPPLPVFASAGDADPLGDLRGFRRLPMGWEIEWHRFFEGLPTSGPDTQHARAFDTKLSTALHQLPPLVDQMRRSLATLNLKRGVALELPSGEDVAAAVAAKLGLDPASLAIATGLSHPAPLWFWFLREAETAAGGQHLGPVGGRIVAEVLTGLAQNDKSSFLRARPDWVPTLPGAVTATFTMADLLTLTGATL